MKEIKFNVELTLKAKSKEIALIQLDKILRAGMEATGIVVETSPFFTSEERIVEEGGGFVSNQELDKTKRLSEFVSKEEDIEHLEDVVWNGEVIIDKGFYLEVYINADGVYGDEEGEHSSNGYSIFKYINKDISMDDFLNLELFDEGSLKDSTMTIHVIPSKDALYEAERNMCTDLF